jgi:hypothetical protein
VIAFCVFSQAFAVLCYLLYFDKSPGFVFPSPVTDGLAQGTALQRVAAFALCGDLLFTFTIVFVAGRDVVESSLFDKNDHARFTYVKRCASARACVCVSR